MKFRYLKIFLALTLLANSTSAGRSGTAGKDPKPKDDLVASSQALDLQKGDKLIDKKGKTHTIVGFGENGAIAVDNKLWINSLKYIAVAKGSRDGFRVGDKVYDDDGYRGQVKGFYADGKACWTGPDMRIKTRKLHHIQSEGVAKLAVEKKHKKHRKHRHHSKKEEASPKCVDQVAAIETQVQAQMQVQAEPTQVTLIPSQQQMMQPIQSETLQASQADQNQQIQCPNPPMSLSAQQAQDCAQQQAQDQKRWCDSSSSRG